MKRNTRSQGITVFAYERTATEDKLIDYIISFENLFSKEGESVDLVTHKLKLRFSRLFRQKAEDRRAAYNDMGKFYVARSKIVHGDKKQAMNEVEIERLEEYIRSSLKLYLKKKGNNESHDDIICNIDFS